MKYSDEESERDREVREKERAIIIHFWISDGCGAEGACKNSQAKVSDSDETLENSGCTYRKPGCADEATNWESFR